MKETLAELLKSKKFVALVVGVLSVISVKMGLDLDEGSIEKIVALIGTYLVSQVIADHGKEAEKVRGS